MLGACTTVGPDFARPRVAWLEHWKGGSLAPLVAGPQPKGPIQAWWRHFKDPVLDSLIEQAQRRNPDVRTAGMRILEARAQLGIADSARYPQVQRASGELLRVGERRSGGPGPDTSTTTFNAALDIQWELDFWGKFRRGIEAADAAYLASVAQYDDVQVLMAAQVANLYCTIRTFEARLQIARDNAAIQKRSLEITARLFKSGYESELDVEQARSLYLGTLAGIPALDASLRQAQNALSILLARPPGPLPEMDPGRSRIPQAGLALIVDMPAELLRRRPDVRAAEMQLAAQSALIGVSAADLYPSISLLGSLGLAATTMSGSPQVVSWALGPGLVWNVFDHGRLASTVLVQDARFQQLYERYQGTVLQAAREVDDAAVGFARTGEQVALLADAVQAARRSLDIATVQYREGLTDYQRVIDSQRTFFSQQDLLATSRGNLTQSLIAIYKAMGGGWEGGRGRPVVDEATGAAMRRRSGWGGLLDIGLPAPAAADRPPRP
jgi:NodT family efflux transporter outer membrane factor (OMF) lipoprotein